MGRSFERSTLVVLLACATTVATERPAPSAFDDREWDKVPKACVDDDKAPQIPYPRPQAPWSAFSAVISHRRIGRTSPVRSAGYAMWNTIGR